METSIKHDPKSISTIIECDETLASTSSDISLNLRSDLSSEQRAEILKQFEKLSTDKKRQVFDALKSFENYLFISQKKYYFSTESTILYLSVIKFFECFGV